MLKTSLKQVYNKFKIHSFDIDVNAVLGPVMMEDLRNFVEEVVEGIEKQQSPVENEKSACEGEQSNSQIEEKVLGKHKGRCKGTYPYFQNLKRRKLDSVTVFDPYRPVEPSLLVSLDTFMELDNDRYQSGTLKFICY